LAARSLGRVAEEKILTLIALFIAAFILIFTGVGYALIGESEPWDTLALLLVGCGILVFAVAVALLRDWHIEGALTGGLTDLARVFGVICLILVVLLGGVLSQNQRLQNQLNNSNDLLHFGSFEVIATGSNMSLPQTWVFAGSVGPRQIPINETMPYEGTIVVEVSSTSNNTFVSLNYDPSGIEFGYDYNLQYPIQEDVGFSGTAFFPFSPTMNFTEDSFVRSLSITVGAQNSTIGVEADVTLLYYY
jgi:hypothetical protein